MKNKLKYYLINVPVAILGGILGALGGQEGKHSKLIRRLGIPILITAIAYIRLHNIWVLSILSSIGVLSLGYGIPELVHEIGKPNLVVYFADKGSFLGRFFWKITHQNHKLSDMLTRGTVGCFFVLSLIAIPIIKHNWLVYVLCGKGIILAYAFLSWKGFGELNMFGKKLLIVDILVYSLITVSYTHLTLPTKRIV